MTIKTYHAESRIRYLSAGAALAVLALIAFAVLIQSPGDWTKRVLAGTLGVLAFILACFLFIGSRSRIITSPQGLAYHTFGFSIATTWDNLERIDRIPVFQDARPARFMFGKNRRLVTAREVEGLVLRQPVNIKASAWERGAAGAQRHIILSEEFGKWREIGLAQDFRHYAPHLFTQETQPP